MNPQQTIHRENQPVQALAELADIGMNLARAAGRQALEQIERAPPIGNEPQKGPDHTLTFTRAARCVRQTFALEAKLTAGPAKPKPEPTAYKASGPIPGGVCRQNWNDPRRSRIGRIVREFANANPTDPDSETSTDTSRNASKTPTSTNPSSTTSPSHPSSK